MEPVTKNLTRQKDCTVNLNSTTTQKVNILMVDNQPENLLALEAVLSSPHYNLVSATSGNAALKCLLKQEFAVILLDVQMPELNGFETAKLIRAREKTKHIPIIFITAISQDMEHVQRGYSVGAIDYIFKPYQPETLKQKIEKFVEIYQKYKEEISKSESQCSAELNEVNKKLDQTTLDLQRTEALAKVISETLIDTIVTFNGQGSILSVNSAVKTMFGYHPDELVGQPIGNLFLKVKGDNRNSSPYLFFSLINSCLGSVIESVALRKDESHFPADIQIGETAVDGHPIFVCTIRDVTERKLMEEVKKKQFNQMENMVKDRTLELLLANERLQIEIEERKKITDYLFVSQERFRKIFESSPCLVAIISLKDKTYLDVNTSWINITGYSYDELIHQKINFLDFIDEPDGNYLHLGQHIRSKKIHYKTKHGEIRAGLLSTEIIDVQPEPCILFVLTDYTERILMEREMSRLDRLNLIGEMAAGIAHEIRNPMTTVSGFLQVARSNSEGLPKEIVDLMLEELSRANSIITEFLNLAKNKVSDKKIQDLNTIIEALFPLIQAEALRSRKQAVLDLHDCPNISVDEKEIRQLILNIVLNGLDSMSSGGQLTIKTYAEEQAVILEIKDQGIGISSEILEKIGTPFFTTKENGTGLGLAICYSVAERHQADIDIETGDAGSTFSIRFKPF
ncbi:Sensor histidine kinase RcsC [Neobacillus rhizosphaerae]|uniref:histidine kinase n=1 Tax=Neobacillus rhizosphaerae TaxID=2880965 RepID=A0ABM9EPM6_9BACI|nr:PAS domain S-box protein [Neobacillus rhizosphaerae]CAH2714581.1 Sensor histidine kinase RcsC [Neobacillus rhizosphaerae]